MDTYETVATSKGQVVIPSKVRRQLGDSKKELTFKSM